VYFSLVISSVYTRSSPDSDLTVISTWFVGLKSVGNCKLDNSTSTDLFVGSAVNETSLLFNLILVILE
jgi:hypothetical protein